MFNNGRESGKEAAPRTPLQRQAAVTTTCELVIFADTLDTHAATALRLGRDS